MYTRNYTPNYTPNYGGNGGFYQRTRNHQQNQPKKRSGAKFVPIKKGQNQGSQGIAAWNYSKERGLVTVFIAPTQFTQQHKSQNGRVWENHLAKIFFHRTGQTILKSALYDKERGFAIIKEMAWKVNPRAANGGYCGTYFKKK